MSKPFRGRNLSQLLGNKAGSQHFIILNERKQPFILCKQYKPILRLLSDSKREHLLKGIINTLRSQTDEKQITNVLYIIRHQATGYYSLWWLFYTIEQNASKGFHSFPNC